MDNPGREECKFRKTLSGIPHTFLLENDDAGPPRDTLCKKLIKTLQADINDGLPSPLETSRCHNLLSYLYFMTRYPIMALEHANTALEQQGEGSNLVSLANKAVILWRQDREEAKHQAAKLLDMKKRADPVKTECTKRTRETTVDSVEKGSKLTEEKKAKHSECVEENCTRETDVDFHYLVVKAKAELAYTYTRLGGLNYSRKAVEMFTGVLREAREPDLWLWKFGLVLTQRRLLHMQTTCPVSQATEDNDLIAVLNSLKDIIHQCDCDNLKAKCLAEIAMVLFSRQTAVSKGKFEQVVKNTLQENACRIAHAANSSTDNLASAHSDPSVQWPPTPQQHNIYVNNPQDRFHGSAEKRLRETMYQTCDRALLLGHDDASVLWKVAKIYRCTNRLKEAVQLLKKSLDLRPTSTEYHQLGLAYKALANRDVRERGKWPKNKNKQFRNSANDYRGSGGEGAGRWQRRGRHNLTNSKGETDVSISWTGTDRELSYHMSSRDAHSAKRGAPNRGKYRGRGSHNREREGRDHGSGSQNPDFGLKGADGRETDAEHRHHVDFDRRRDGGCRQVNDTNLIVSKNQNDSGKISDHHDASSKWKDLEQTGQTSTTKTSAATNKATSPKVQIEREYTRVSHLEKKPKDVIPQRNDARGSRGHNQFNTSRRSATVSKLNPNAPEFSYSQTSYSKLANQQSYTSGYNPERFLNPSGCHQNITYPDHSSKFSSQEHQNSSLLVSQTNQESTVARQQQDDLKNEKKGQGSNSEDEGAVGFSETLIRGLDDSLSLDSGFMTGCLQLSAQFSGLSMTDDTGPANEIPRYNADFPLNSQVSHKEESMSLEYAAAVVPQTSSFSILKPVGSFYSSGEPQHSFTHIQQTANSSITGSPPDANVTGIEILCGATAVVSEVCDIAERQPQQLSSTRISNANVRKLPVQAATNPDQSDQLLEQKLLKLRVAVPVMPTMKEINTMKKIVKSPSGKTKYSRSDKNVAKALEAFKKAADLSEFTNTRAMYDWALMLRGLGENDEALKLLETILHDTHHATGPFDKISSYEQVGLIKRDLSEIETDAGEREKLRKDSEAKLYMALLMCSSLCQQLPRFQFFIKHVWNAFSVLMESVDVKNCPVNEKDREKAKLFQLIRENLQSNACLCALLNEDPTEAQNPQYLRLKIKNCVDLQQYREALQLFSFQRLLETHDEEDEHYSFARICILAGREALTNKTCTEEQTDASLCFSMAFEACASLQNENNEDERNTENSEHSDGDDEDAVDVMLLHGTSPLTDNMALALKNVLQHECGLRVKTCLQDDQLWGRPYLNCLSQTLSRCRMVVVLAGADSFSNNMQCLLEAAADKILSRVLLRADGDHVPKIMTTTRTPAMVCPSILLDVADQDGSTAISTVNDYAPAFVVNSACTISAPAFVVNSTCTVSAVPVHGAEAPTVVVHNRSPASGTDGVVSPSLPAAVDQPHPPTDKAVLGARARPGYSDPGPMIQGICDLICFLVDVKL